jgi:hypothetical protein
LTAKWDKMDLERLATILPQSSTGASLPTEVRLFDAIRKWLDAEDNETEESFAIEFEGKRLTHEQIQAISQTDAYKDRLLERFPHFMNRWDSHRPANKIR